MGLTEQERAEIQGAIDRPPLSAPTAGAMWHDGQPLALALQRLLQKVWAALAEAERKQVGFSNRAYDAEGLLAGLADCINQELRENGPVDTPQITNYLGAVDMRHFVRLLVDLVRQKLESRLRVAEEENGRLRAALARDVGAFAQAVREGQVPGCYLTPEQLAQVREALVNGETVLMILYGRMPGPGGEANEFEAARGRSAVEVLVGLRAALSLLGPAERSAGKGEGR